MKLLVPTRVFSHYYFPFEWYLVLEADTGQGGWRVNTRGCGPSSWVRYFAFLFKQSLIVFRLFRLPESLLFFLLASPCPHPKIYVSFFIVLLFYFFFVDHYSHSGKNTKKLRHAPTPPLSPPHLLPTPTQKPSSKRTLK